MPKEVISLQFTAPGKDDKTESKNYDIYDRPGNADKRSPVLIGSNGRLYIQKGLVDPKKVRTLSLVIVTEK